MLQGSPRERRAVQAVFSFKRYAVVVIGLSLFNFRYSVMGRRGDPATP